MPNDEKAPIMVRVYDGTRELMPAGMQLLFRVIDGNKKKRHEDFHEKPVLRADVPFFDNFRDKYTVIVSADNYVQSGFYPVPVKPGVLSIVDVMLLPQNNQFNFRAALWGNLKQTHPGLSRILGQGVGESAAEDRYTQLMEKEPRSLAAFLNITAALEQVLFSTGTPLDLLETLIWDDPNAAIASDRFFAFADSAPADRATRDCRARRHLRRGPERVASWGDTQLQASGVRGSKRPVDTSRKRQKVYRRRRLRKS